MADAPQLFALTDIQTKEVSIVDAAANLRRFITVKSKGASMATKGAAVVGDGKGGHTISKDTPTPPAAPGAPAPAAATAPAAGAPPAAAPPAGPTAEPVIALSPEAKAELVKRVTAAKTRLDALTALLEKATETAGLVEIPAEIATAVAEILTGLAQGETEKSAAVLKGLPQFSAARTAQIVAAHNALGELLAGVTKPVPAAEPPAAEQEVDVDAALAKAVAKAFAPLEEKLAKGLLGITALVERHGAAIEKQAGRVEDIAKGASPRPTPRSGSAEGEQVAKDAGEEDVTEPGGWPSDMADPDRHDVNKVKPENRFTTSARR